MKHLGDITKVNGAEIEPVHCIIGGSPCQDLSIAGKRVGLSGERSGLFVEQVRIVKEMREKYGTAYPRFMVWENVPGAFSSNKGRDFAAVLTEIIRIVRRLTPVECERLQGFPDGWTDIGDYTDSTGKKRKTSDSARYKTLFSASLGLG
nr:MAG TPA_asm: Cytosine specific methyltransferase [Caudoviricetes sp.]